MLRAKEWKLVWEDLKKIVNPSIEDLHRIIQDYKNKSTCNLRLVKG